MSIYKDKGTNTYYVKYRNNGKSTTKRGFNTKSEAKLFEYQLMISKEKAAAISFEDVSYAYLDYVKNNCSYGTYTKMKRFIEEFILPNMPRKNIDSIKDLDCLKFRELVNKLDYSSEYKNAMIGVLKRIFKFAAMYYDLKNNPSLKIQRFKQTTKEKKEKRDKQMNIWNNEEFEKFINCVNDRTYKCLFILLYYTGMRRGECLALKWSDFHDSKISINKSITRKTDKGDYEIKEPKNVFSIRDITLNRSLNDYLLQYKEEEMKIKGFSDDWFIFGRIYPLAENTITRMKDRAIKKAGVKRIRLHDFRHSHASNLIANGVNIVAVSKRLGHSDINMTLSKYTHLLQKSDDELTENLEICSQNVLNNKEKPYK